MDPELEALLTSEPLSAHLATCREGRPHAAPVWYRYEDGAVELTTTGQKLANLRANPRVALSVEKAEGGHPEWNATLLGTASVVEDGERARAIHRRINRKYGAREDAWSENTPVLVDVGTATYGRY